MDFFPIRLRPWLPFASKVKVIDPFCWAFYTDQGRDSSRQIEIQPVPKMGNWSWPTDRHLGPFLIHRMLGGSHKGVRQIRKRSRNWILRGRGIDGHYFKLQKVLWSRNSY
ncbi:hypothetical protein CEXT_329241 [Caerostris extrusa]|uniref:Uncharacterized protein n=1 Tax=Caerostris extrusa TaxID=172846 RepID=A0AAV4U801_CAEEX|nr:hypothetical protein CEXT_329241 [Caerostris extrusa]